MTLWLNMKAQATQAAHTLQHLWMCSACEPPLLQAWQSSLLLLLLLLLAKELHSTHYGMG
jgi:hypothetical protein